MTKIFISYRRDDSADVAGRIDDRLAQKYGRDNVFKDVDSIPLGVDFRTVLREAVGRCQVLLAVIGRDWLRISGAAGGRRLDDPADFVRLEIEAALLRDIPVIPVLVGGALMPPGDQLPPPLQALVFRNGIAVRRDPDFHTDMNRLVKSLDQLLGGRSAPPPAPVLEPADEPSPRVRKGGEEQFVDLGDGVKMTFCWVPQGEAQLGSPKAERAEVLRQIGEAKEPEWLASEAEEVRGKFKTKGFWLAKYPLTQAQYQALMKTNPSYFVVGQEQIKKDNITNTSRFPVENISWDDCQLYLKELNRVARVPSAMGKGLFVLPHENEWEYGCRGGKGNRQPFYFGSALKGDFANCDGNYPFGTETKGEYKQRTTEVGSYERLAPHPWGLCDMHGNVYQWCENKYKEDENSRVLRGGSWSHYAWVCRAAGRRGAAPSDLNMRVGCRVAFRLD